LRIERGLFFLPSLGAVSMLVSLCLFLCTMVVELRFFGTGSIECRKSGVWLSARSMLAVCELLLSRERALAFCKRLTPLALSSIRDDMSTGDWSPRHWLRRATSAVVKRALR